MHRPTIGERYASAHYALGPNKPSTLATDIPSTSAWALCWSGANHVKRGSMTLRSTTFDQAALDFRQFLSSHGWPTDVLWVRRSWLARKLTRRWHALNGEANARAVYSRGVHAGLGVAIEGLWRDGRHTYAQVTRPVNEDASERLLFPVDGLKMSLPTAEQEDVNSSLRWYLQDLDELEQSALTT